MNSQIGFNELRIEAKNLDSQDIIAPFKQRFCFPEKNGKPVVYMCGNSLGLMPVHTPQYVVDELQEWQKLGVEGHFAAKNPWFSYHKILRPTLAKLMGAKEHEVVGMNSLTANLHLLLTSFYTPVGDRTVIVMVGSEFPSDRYALETHVRSRGLEPRDCIVEVHPAPGKHTILDADIITKINELGSRVALVMFSGVHYYTGQCFDIQAITSAAHAVGANAGFDLAHAAGNMQLQLHEWNVDFAVWCSYKYLNAGPGAVGGAFVHEKHADSATLNRLAGWWGNDESTRFDMHHGFVPSYGADGWQLSNAPVLSMAALKASLDIFDEAGIENLAIKRSTLTALLADAIELAINITDTHQRVQIITPDYKPYKGAQLSVHFEGIGKQVFDALLARGIIVDWRTPSVVRIAPAPLYTSFEDVVVVGETLAQILGELV